MRILVIGADYAPDEIGIAPYTTGLAEHLASRGHTTRVITTFPHYPSYRWTSATYLHARSSVRNVDITRVWCILPRRPRPVWRLAFDFSFALFAGMAALLTPRPDVIVTVCVPIQTAVVGGLLARVWGRRSVLIVQDLPLEAAVATGHIDRRGLAYRVGRLFERVAFALNGRIVVISRRYREYITSLGVSASAITEIPNWAPQPDPTLVPSMSDSPTRDRPFVVTHAGNMGAKQDLSNAVAAAAQASGIELWLIGDGSQRAHLERAVALTHAPVRVIGLQPREQLLALLRTSDALLINQAPKVIDSVVPSKLLTYMTVGRPIVAAVHHDSTTAEIVREAKCGIVVEPDNPAALARELQRLAQLPPSDRDSMGEAALAYSSRFDRANVLAALEEVVVGRGEPPPGDHLWRFDPPFDGHHASAAESSGGPA